MPHPGPPSSVEPAQEPLEGCLPRQGPHQRFSNQATSGPRPCSNPDVLGGDKGGPEPRVVTLTGGLGTRGMDPTVVPTLQPWPRITRPKNLVKTIQAAKHQRETQGK